jgi:hypothetical protein
MSKIALSGNASGTGVFTLASPNSSTDRTLTLPDGSGELYNQSNIVGTVSESGGVPTGAIIERGSNANGEYVKYADGTMICTRGFTLPNDNVLYEALCAATFSSDENSASMSVVDMSGGGVNDRINAMNATGYGCSASRWRLRKVTTTGSSVNAQLVAIGRWY